MKGYTDIELTNVNTGEVKKYHDENMLTNGVMYALSQSPYCFGTFHKARKYIMADKPPSWRLMGGLLLFDKQLEENPETLVPPDGVRMVGNAVAGVSNSSGVPEFGNFDAKSSTYEVSGKTAVQKLVYTFDTTQANGTIACVCLASAQAGYYGFGNHSGQKITNSDDWNFKDNSFPSGNIPFNSTYYDSEYISLINSSDKEIVFADYKKNFAVLVDRNIFSLEPDTKNAKLILSKVHIPMSKTGVISLSPYADTGRHYEYEKKEIPLPDAEVKAIYDQYYKLRAMQIITDSTKAYLVWWGYADEKRESGKFGIHVWEITSDLQLIKKTFGFDAYVNQDEGNKWCVAKNGVLYVLFELNQNGHYFSYIAEIDIASGVQTRQKLPEKCSGIGKYMDKIILNKDSGNAYVYDTVFKKLIPINGRDARYYNQIHGAKHLLVIGKFLLSAPAYLATINNLSEPVVKTPELVMKITYTLTTELET